MANRRMFSLDVVDTDKFLEMPASSQNLYFHLGMRADDDGFVSSPKKITKLVNCGEDDLNVLISRGFVIAFDGGIVVIRHWKQNNYIQRDRYKTTIYQKELSALIVDNGVYEIDSDTKNIHPVSDLYPECIQAVSNLEAQDSIGKYSIDKNTTYSCSEPIKLASEPSIEPPVISLILNDKTYYNINQEAINEWKKLYPAVDIVQELKKMKGWCDSNSARRKTRRGIRRFINGWLAKEQDRNHAYQENIHNRNGGSGIDEAARYEAEQRASYGKY